MGQQQYDAYLQKLNDNIPELYQLAANRYDQEGQDLLNQYNMASNAENAEYEKYRDALNDYWSNVNYLTGRADTAYENGSSNWYNSYNLGMQQDQLDYSKRQDAYSNLTNLIGNTGYSPTDAELSAAGMSRGEADAWRNAYAQQLAAASAKSSGGSSGGSSRKRSGSKSRKSGSSSSSSSSNKIEKLYLDRYEELIKNGRTDAQARSLARNWAAYYGTENNDTNYADKILRGLGYNV